MIKQKIDLNLQSCQKRNKTIEDDLSEKLVDVLQSLRKEIDEKEASVQKACDINVDILRERIERYEEKVDNDIMDIKSCHNEMNLLIKVSSNELQELKACQDKILKNEEISSRKLESFQDLNNALISNIKQSVKNNENQIAMSEKDVKNQLTLLDHKMNQKVFTQETLKKIESRFCELDLSCSNIRNEIENMITKFNDLKVSKSNMRQARFLLYHLKISTMEMRNGFTEKLDVFKEKDKEMKTSLMAIEFEMKTFGRFP